MFGADKPYLTIYINDGVVKVAQASSSGSLEKIARASYLASAGGGADAAGALRTVLGGFNRKAAVVCAVPANAATAKTIEVPSTDPEEIKSIINLQASRHTPYSREEVLISYMNLGLTAANNTRLLLVIVQRDVVKERISAMEQAGLDVEKVLFVPEAQARLCARLMNIKRDSAPVGIMDFAFNAATYLVLARGVLLFVRHIPVGVKALLAAGDAPARLQEEIGKSMEACAQENNAAAPAAYTVTSGQQAVVNALPALKQALNIELSVSTLADLLKCPKSLRKKLESDFGDDSFLDVIAPSITGGRCEINLMPEEMVLKKTVDRQSKEGSRSVVAAVVLMVLAGVLMMSKIYFKDTFLNKNLRQQFAPQIEQVQKLESQMGKVKLVRGYLKSRMVSLDVLHELYVMTPHSVYLNAIAMDEDGLVTIDGITDSMSQVFSYVKSLNDSLVFKEAKTKSTATKKDNSGKDVAAFQIEFRMDKEQA